MLAWFEGHAVENKHNGEVLSARVTNARITVLCGYFHSNLIRFLVGAVIAAMKKGDRPLCLGLIIFMKMPIKAVTL